MEENEPKHDVDTVGLTVWDFIAIFKANWRTLAAFGVLGLMLGGIGGSFIQPTFSSKTVVHIAANRGTTLDVGASVVGSPTMWTHAAHLNTQLQIMRSGDARHKIAQRYEQQVEGAKLSPSSLNGMINLRIRKESELVDITATTDDPQKSADLANLTAEVMADNAIDARIEAARDAKVWLAAQIEEYDERITIANAKLVEYHRGTDISEIGSETTALGVQLESLKAAYGQARTERVVAETTLNGYDSLFRQGHYLDLAEQLPSPLMDPLATEFAKAKVTQDAVAREFLEKMPKRQEADYKLAEAERRLKAEVKRVIASQRSLLKIKRNKELDLKKAITGGIASSLDFSAPQEDYLKLQLDLESAKTVFESMKSRMAELQLQSNTQLNHIRIIDRARPASSSKAQDVQTMIGAGGVGGLLLGALLIGFREYLDDTVKSPFDVVTYVKVPVIGLLPRVISNDEQERTLYTHLFPRSPIAEATRALRTYIELNPGGQAPRRLMVTSAVSTEGKTSTAVRLATSYANLGRTVVLVDLDLRRPRMHKVFGDTRDMGATSMLLDNASIEDVAKPTPIPGLSYIASGPSVTHPGELLASDKLPAMLDRLSAHFDMVLVDTPPSVLIADARVVSHHVDATCIIVRDKATSRVPVRDAVRGLQLVGANLLGVILNDVDLSKVGPSYGYTYRYGYSYQYAYGYNYGAQDDATETAAK